MQDSNIKNAKTYIAFDRPGMSQSRIETNELTRVMTLSVDADMHV